MERGEGQILVVINELHLDRKFDRDVARVDADQIGDQTGPFFKLDQTHREGIVKGGNLGIVVDDEAVHDASTAGFDGVPIRRAAGTAHRFGRVPERAAGGASLDQQLVLLAGVKPPGVVEREGGARP